MNSSGAVPVPVAIQNRESIWFSSNVRVLLGEIVTIRLTSIISLNFTMYVIEHDEQAFSTIIPNEILCANKVNVSSKVNSKISLLQPILIHPNKMYEIRLERPDGTTNIYKEQFQPKPPICKEHFQWKQEINLNEEVTIKFHQSPFEYNSEHRGLVRELRFNQL